MRKTTLKKLPAALAALACGAAFAADPFVGEYQGTISGMKTYPYGHSPVMSAQISKHRDGYRLRILPELCKRSNDELLATGLKAEGGKIRLDGAGKWKFSGEITPEAMNFDVSEGKNSGKISLRKIERASPTLGAPAPAGASTLFDGSSFDGWATARDGSPVSWKMVEGGAMEVAKLPGKDANKSQTIRSKAAFSDFRLHLEFMTCDMPNQEAQQRSNSGVFIGPYEIQILDSFGAEGLWNDCGAIYRVSPPIANACLPPEKWQTYDIDFTAAKFSSDGKLVSAPRVTVFLNGVKVQSDMEIPHATSIPQPRRDSFRHPKPPYRIELQDHGNPVRFRNIWAMPLNAEK